ncbi:hypothetical protein PVK06_040623 [Gossypium arboreum]|uniref:Uncharacterized protein n=1 Tax=Gossypium arboreum TaxID=29729 RepID=A0ABR0N8T4_GOSAR|nr:hypothetical protein PVK06_040623 [Gossypium arboreum]
MRLGLSARGAEAKEAKNEKKPVECFLCHGPHRLWKYPRKSTIKGNDASDKEPKKLSSSNEKFEANKVKKSKKKRVKCFFYRGSHELQNYPKQAVFKEKATLELVESSERILPKKEVNLSLDLGEKVTIKKIEARTNGAELKESDRVFRVIGEASTHERGEFSIRLRGKSSDASFQVRINEAHFY